MEGLAELKGETLIKAKAIYLQLAKMFQIHDLTIPFTIRHRLTVAQHTRVVHLGALPNTEL